MSIDEWMFMNIERENSAFQNRDERSILEGLRILAAQ